MVLAWLLSNWRLVAVGVLMLTLGGYAMTMRLERDAVKAEYVDYRENVAKAAVAAAEAALQKTIADEKRKEEADAENLRLRADLDTTARKLRDARAAGSFVPPAPSGAASPVLACFGRDDLERALQQLDAGVSGLLAEGDRAVVDLDTAKRWAASGR